MHKSVFIDSDLSPSPFRTTAPHPAPITQLDKIVFSYDVSIVALNLVKNLDEVQKFTNLFPMLEIEGLAWIMHNFLPRDNQNL